MCGDGGGHGVWGIGGRIGVAMSVEIDAGSRFAKQVEVLYRNMYESDISHTHNSAPWYVGQLLSYSMVNSCRSVTNKYDVSHHCIKCLGISIEVVFTHILDILINPVCRLNNIEESLLPSSI